MRSQLLYILEWNKRLYITEMGKEGNLNDFLLILQMKQGNEKAFDKFVRKYYAEILSYCRYHCLDQAEAEDLTQETFLRFMENIASYQHSGKAKNYLYVIAGNLCKNYAKKWKAESVEQEILERELVSDGGIQRKEKRMDVEQALGRLTPELREVILLIYFGDCKLKEVADILQIGLPLVKYRHKRAKEELKKLLGEEDSDEFGNKTIKRKQKLFQEKKRFWKRFKNRRKL